MRLRTVSDRGEGGHEAPPSSITGRFAAPLELAARAFPSTGKAKHADWREVHHLDSFIGRTMGHAPSGADQRKVMHPRSAPISFATAATLMALVLPCTSSCGRREAPSTQKAPTPVPSAAARSGGSSRRDPSGFAGVGWSINPDTEGAVTEAAAKAGGRAEEGGLTMVFYTPHHDPHRVAEAARRAGPPSRRNIGFTTHVGVLTSDGYIDSDTGVVGVLTTHLADVLFGLGIASFDEAAPAEAAKLAYRRAVADAHKSKGERPAMIVMFGTMTAEEALLGALAEEAGPDVPLIGGTAAGLASMMERKTKEVASSMFVDDHIVGKGVGITVYYSPHPFAWAYSGGYTRGSGKGGVVTDAEGRLLRKIDDRPAVDVYDEWLGGRLSQAKQEGKNVQNFLALYPLVQTVTKNGVSHNQVIRAWPSNKPEAPGSLTTGANVSNGEVIYTSEGSENILVNRFAALPRQAKKNANDMAASAGFFIYCAGALQTIPREHRGNIAALVGESMGDMPWIGVFTWGEQGSIPGIGNQHGNLMASTVLFPSADGSRRN